MLMHLVGNKNDMLQNIHPYHLILASGSPRRKELLAGLGLPFQVRLSDDADESYPEELKGASVAHYLAEKKSNACLKTANHNELIITADTLVCLDDVVFGKPLDRTDAIRMLTALSGKCHSVYTGVCLSTKTKRTTFVSETKVWFSELDINEIHHYVDVFKPFDKAGAYGVQEWIGYVAVERMEGSFYNVMGLPVHQLYTELKQFPQKSILL